MTSGSPIPQQWGAERAESTTRDAALLAGCLILGLGFRLAVIWTGPDQLTADRDVYLAIAQGVAEGRGYSVPNSTNPTAFRPPFYPVCLAGPLLVVSPPVAVALVNLIASALTVWFTASLGNKLGLGQLRFLAAALVAVDPLLLRYSAQPMTESVCTCIAVFWLWSMIGDSTGGGDKIWRQGLRCGVAFGLLVLCRPTFWPLAGLCGIVWLIQSRRSLRAISATAKTRVPVNLLAIVIGTAVIVAPWVVRNWLVFGFPILTTTHGGYTLALGNNPVFYEQVVRKPWGTVWQEASLNEWTDQMTATAKQELGPAPSELQIDAWESRQARSYIAKEPVHFLQAAVHRVRSLWNTSPQAESGNLNPRIISVLHWYYTLFLTAGLCGAGIVIWRDDFGKWLPLFALILTVQCVHIFYWTNTRMRAPLTPAIALFSAALVATMFGEGGRRSRGAAKSIDITM
jgi:hypothetical protein